jgi:hypothetical protein
VSQTLLAMGANVQAVDPQDTALQSPLHKAAKNGSAELLKVLLAKHPDGLDETDQVRESGTGGREGGRGEEREARQGMEGTKQTEEAMVRGRGEDE